MRRGVLDRPGSDRRGRSAAQRHDRSGDPPDGSGQGVLDRHRVPDQLHRGHAPGGAPVRRLRPRPHVPGGAALVRHRVRAGGDSAELRVDRRRPRAPGGWRWRDGPHRPGDGSGSCRAGATRRCTWPRGRLGRGRLRAGAPLWGRHHRVDRLAVDILAGRPPELDADRAAGHSAEPRQHRGEDGLPGGDRAGWGTDRAHDRAVAAEHLLAGVLRPLSAARHRPPAGRRVDRGRETGGPATARVVPVPLQGVPRVQHHAVPRGGRADYLAGRGAPHVRHGHGEGGLGERAPPDPPDGRHTGWGRWSRVTSSDARACGR